MRLVSPHNVTFVAIICLLNFNFDHYDFGYCYWFDTSIRGIKEHNKMREIFEIERKLILNALFVSFSSIDASAYSRHSFAPQKRNEFPLSPVIVDEHWNYIRLYCAVVRSVFAYTINSY